MAFIYEPKGKAREYSELACNLHKGCSYKCVYCYCPSISRMDMETWSKKPILRKGILEGIDKELKKVDKTKELMFCFMSDPYQENEFSITTRHALELCEYHHMENVNVLTKNGKLAERDFDILKRNNWKFGSTIIFKSEKLREIWEPGAPSIESRIKAVKKAHSIGIYTWVSMEPVVDVEESYKIFKELKQFVNKWKVGKLNHNKQHEKTIDWKLFYETSKQLLEGSDVYWKNDLLKEANILQ